MGKKTNKERRRLREERQAAQRRAERRRNLVTLGLVVGIMAVGGVLVWLSLESGTQTPAQAPQDGQGGESGQEGQGAQGGESDADGGASEGAGASGGDGSDGGGQPGGDGAGEGGPTSGTGGTGDREVACGGSVPASAGEAKPTFDEPRQVLEGVENPRARLTTSCGEVVLDLDVERAPQAANSFAFLAQEGFFDGLRFFRSRPGMDMVQAGAGDNTGTWDVGYTLPAELEAARQDGYPPRAVALAVPEGDPAGGGSQFFIVYGDRFMDAIVAGGLKRIYPRFATVTEGLDVVRRIGGIEVVESGGQQRPAQRVYIETVEIEAA